MIQRPNKVLIVHGWEADSKSNWFPKAKIFFESKGYSVLVPDFPGNYFPDYNGWMKIIRELEPDENTILIGHSLGAVAIMRYLEQAERSVFRVILTAMPLEPMSFTPIASFFPTDWQWEKIKAKAKNFNLIYEEGDQVVPLDHGKIVAEKLGAGLIVVPGASHLLKLDVNLLEKIINDEK